MKFIFLLILGILLISSVSAIITCNPQSMILSYRQGSFASNNTYCVNDGNSTTISLSGETTLFSTTETNFNMGSKTIPINFLSTASAGFHSGAIVFGEGSNPVPIFFNVLEETNPPQTCSIDIFPTILANVKIQQGETKTRTIQLSVPSCYESSVKLNNVQLQTDEKPIQLSELSLGTIQLGNSIMIPIEINAAGVSIGQYSDVLQFLVYDNNGNKINVPSVSISVLVTQGIQPITDFNISSLPSCSLSAIELNFNSTYKMTCTNPNPNIQIRPIIDKKYIVGLSVSEGSSQYIYEFKALMLGQSTIEAEFLYKNAPIGTPFVQEIRITSSGNAPVQGTNLDVIFYQNSVKKNLSNLNSGNTVIVVIDNKTNSVVSSYSISLNGIATNNTFELESQKSYDLRVSSPGFVDLVVNFNVSENPLNLEITPQQAVYYTGEFINFISSENNTHFLVNDVIVSSPYALTSEGNFTIKTVKEGFLSANKTINVKRAVMLLACTPIKDKWKIGKKVICELSENSSWSVYNNGAPFNSGSSKTLEFKINSEGIYDIRINERILSSQIIEKKGLFSWISWDNLTSNWLIFIIILAIIVILFYSFLKKGKGSTSSGIGFEMSPKE